MGKCFSIPRYLEDRVVLNGTEIEISFIKKLIFEDLLSYTEIAKVLSDRVNSNIARPTITKICKHYGISISEDIKHKRNRRRAEKTAENLQKSFGVSNVFQLDSVKQKAAETKLDRYGDGSYTNKGKAAKTCLERYGMSNYSSTEECREKVRATNLAKYGTNTPAQNPAILEKMKNTCVEKFGVDNYWKSDEFRKAQQQKYFDKFPDLTATYKEIYQDPERLREYINALADKTTIGIAESFNISRASAYTLLAKNDLLDIVDVEHQTSHYEKEIAEYIGTDLCELNNRTALSGKEIDIYVPSKKLGIEVNGTYWHSNLFKAKSYHQEKSKLAEKAGIRLIHIWEYEWLDPVQQNKIKMMLDIALGRVQTRIYAKNCEIRQISNKEAKALNDKVHLQGHRDAKVTYGLFYNNELVQLMSFSQTRYNRNLKNSNSWEIIRGCPGSNNIVVGGVSKLFKHFIKEYDPQEVFSYCDFNKFDGKSYEAIGMEFIGYTAPDMKWLLNDGTVANRKPRHHSELKEQSKAQLFGAGSKKFLWKKEN